MKYAVALGRMYTGRESLIHTIFRPDANGKFFVDTSQISRDWGLVFCEPFDGPLEYRERSKAEAAVDRVASITFNYRVKVYE